MHRVRALDEREPPQQATLLGVRTLCILVAALFFCGAPSIARADCPTAPLASADDMVVSFLAANGVQVASSSLLPSSVKKGMLLYDGSANALKYCDGTNWVALVGSGGGAGISAAGAANEVQFRNTSTGALAADSTFVYDATNHRLGIGATSPTEALEIAVTSAEDPPFDSTPGLAGLLIRNADTSANSMSGVRFSGTDDGGTMRHSGAIAWGKDANWVGGSNNYPGYISIWTRPNGSEEAERLRVTGSGNVGIGTNVPAASALLELAATDKGFLPPRMTTTQRDAITTPATGLMIYNTTNTQFEFFNGAAWSGVGSMTTGQIAAFALSSCPGGWAEYTPARGRFLRGIDNSAGNDPDGTRAPGGSQADDFKTHTHTVTDNSTAVQVYDQGGNAGGTYGTIARPDANGTVSARRPLVIGSTGGTETRPKNVAVIFCQYMGTGNVPAGAATVSGTANYVAKFTAPSIVGNSQIYDNGTNVGIGTVAPAALLDVNGNARIGNGASDFPPFSNSPKAIIANDTTAGIFGMAVSSISGIPSIGLSANTAIKRADVILYDNNGTNAHTAIGGMGISRATSALLTGAARNDIYLSTYTGAGTRLILGTEGEPRIVVDSAGHVHIGRIGTTSSALLDVAGSSTDAEHTNADDLLAPTGSDILRVYNTDDAAIYTGITLRTRTTQSSNWNIANVWKSASNGDLVFRARFGGFSRETVRLTADGNVGIGAVAPSTDGTFTSPVILQVLNSTANAPSILKLGGSSPGNGNGLIELGAAGYLSGDHWNWNPTFGINLATRYNGTTSEFYTPYGFTGRGYGGLSYDLSGNAHFYGKLADTTGGAAVTPPERMTILNNGNVGIGTTTPGAKLDVAGTVNATTYSGLAGSFSRITASVTAVSGGAWNYSAYVGCPANYTLVNWGLEAFNSSGAYSGSGPSYANCQTSGNSIRAAHYSAVANSNFGTYCFGLCVRN